MKKALVTGASSGIGYNISHRLLNLGYEVIGISRTLPNDLLSHKSFTHIKCDLSDEKQTISLCEDLKSQELDILINCAGFGKFEPHEELNLKTITQMSFLNLTAPMLLTNAT